jgi:hypothetical protein
VRLVFGTAGGAATEVEDPSAVIDAEFLFLQGVPSDARYCCAKYWVQAAAEGYADHEMSTALYGRNA